MLDRILVKQKASGHRVLLFSTMTRLLDLLEIYLRWRYVHMSDGPTIMGYLRIDGSTSLEDRYAMTICTWRSIFHHKAYAVNALIAVNQSSYCFCKLAHLKPCS